MTPAGKEVLRRVVELTDMYGYAPTSRELAEHIGLSSNSTVHTHLVNLRQAGAVQWREGSSRTLVVTPAGLRLLEGEGAIVSE